MRREECVFGRRISDQDLDFNVFRAAHQDRLHMYSDSLLLLKLDWRSAWNPVGKTGHKKIFHHATVISDATGTAIKDAWVQCQYCNDVAIITISMRDHKGIFSDQVRK